MKLDDLKKAMKGVVIVNTTPFNKDGSLDLEGMRANTRWLLERTAGKDFVFNPTGSTGEFYAMSDDECKAVIKAIVEEVNGKQPVFVGAGRAATPETIKMCQYAQSAGADGVLVILPYYFVPTEDGMYQHYKQVAESVDIAVIVYNYPAVSGSWIRPGLMARLARIPNIIAVKENTPNLISYIQMRRAVDPKDATILCGLGEQMFSYEAVHGCPGFVSSYANFVPEYSHSIYEAAAAGDFDKMDKIINSLAPFSGFIGKVTASHGPSTGVSGGAVMFVSVIKAAMDIIGLRGGEVRLPLVGLTDEEKAELGNILKDLKIVS